MIPKYLLPLPVLVCLIVRIDDSTSNWTILKESVTNVFHYSSIELNLWIHRGFLKLKLQTALDGNRRIIWTQLILVKTKLKLSNDLFCFCCRANGDCVRSRVESGLRCPLPTTRLRVEKIEGGLMVAGVVVAANCQIILPVFGFLFLLVGCVLTGKFTIEKMLNKPKNDLQNAKKNISQKK